MFEVIFEILLNHKVRNQPHVYEHSAVEAVVNHFDATETPYVFTEVPKDDMTGGTAVFAYFDHTSKQLKMIEFEYRG